MSMTACATSSLDGTRWQGVAGSPAGGSKDSSNDASGSKNGGTQESHDEGGGFYTEEQWEAKHEALIEAQWQAAYGKLLRRSVQTRVW
jgi:hypothetical protein